MKPINQNDLMEDLQYVCREHHSTETALIKVKTDILKSMHNQEIACLILLDLIAAFDTVNHKILIKHLHNRFGLRNKALQWIESYLKNRSQKVAIEGNVLRCILFTLYQSPLESICQKHGVTHHLYADDQQIFFSFNPIKKGSQEECISRLENFIRETELILFGTPQQLQKFSNTTIKMWTSEIEPVKSVRNLGYFMDCYMKNAYHINRICSHLYGTLNKFIKSDPI